MQPNLFGLMDEVMILASAWIAVLCFVGLYAKAYRDNWAQTIGMAMMMMGATVVIYHLLQTHRASWRLAMFVAGTALFATGTAWKAWKHRNNGA